MLRVEIRCPLCGATRKRNVYGYQDVASWTDAEEVHCMRCGNTELEYTVEGQGRG